MNLLVVSKKAILALVAGTGCTAKGYRQPPVSPLPLLRGIHQAANSLLVSGLPCPDCCGHLASMRQTDSIDSPPLGTIMAFSHSARGGEPGSLFPMPEDLRSLRVYFLGQIIPDGSCAESPWITARGQVLGESTSQILYGPWVKLGPVQRLNITLIHFVMPQTGLKW